MSARIPCPRCKNEIPLSGDQLAQMVHCPFCHHAFPLRFSSSAGSKPVQTGSSGQRGLATTVADGSRDPVASTGRRPSLVVVGALSVSGWSFVVGLLAAVVLYAAIFVPSYYNWFGAYAKHWLGDLFVDRGWVQPAIVLLTCWSGAILGFRFRNVLKQRRLPHLDDVLLARQENIRPDNVQECIRLLASLPAGGADHVLSRRIALALRHFQARGSATEVADVLTAQADTDAATVESSYALIKVFIWAIPILGFIGTVLGISQAVGEFSTSLQGAQEVSQVTGKLQGVTHGLAVAFDTTLVALVASMIVMFPARSLQRAEDDLLTSVDQFCVANLLPRLSEGDRPVTVPAQGQRAAAENIAAVVREHFAPLDTWINRLIGVGNSVIEQLQQNWHKIQQQLQETHARQIGEMRELMTVATGKKESQLQSASALADRQLERIDRIAASLVALEVALPKQTAAMESAAAHWQKLAPSQQALVAQVQALAVGGNLQGVLSSLQLAVERLNPILDELARETNEQTNAIDGNRIGALRRAWRRLRGGRNRG